VERLLAEKSARENFRRLRDRGAVDVDEDDTQIANREVFCGELLKRFGKNGTLVQGLVMEKAAPL
jgi:hypothetical protein